MQNEARKLIGEPTREHKLTIPASAHLFSPVHPTISHSAVNRTWTQKRRHDFASRLAAKTPESARAPFSGCTLAVPRDHHRSRCLRSVAVLRADAPR